MQEMDDIALLREYVEHDSEEAFASLVRRDVNKVYSVALRHTSNPHQAEEITQAVFVILARKSRDLGRRVVISGWLYQTSRLTAISATRPVAERLGQPVEGSGEAGNWSRHGSLITFRPRYALVYLPPQNSGWG